MTSWAERKEGEPIGDPPRLARSTEATLEQGGGSQDVPAENPGEGGAPAAAGEGEAGGAGGEGEGGEGGDPGGEADLGPADPLQVGGPGDFDAAEAEAAALVAEAEEKAAEEAEKAAEKEATTKAEKEARAAEEEQKAAVKAAEDAATAKKAAEAAAAPGFLSRVARAAGFGAADVTAAAAAAGAVSKATKNLALEEYKKDPAAGQVKLAKTVVDHVDALLPDLISFADQGTKNTEVYQNDFLVECSKAKIEISSAAFYVILALGTVVNNIRRLQQIVAKLDEKAWKSKVQQFVTKSLTASTRSVTLFPAVKLNSIFPSTLVNLSILVNITKYTEATSDDAKLKILIANQFFGQLNLDDAMQFEHKAWEKNFWNTVVKKTTLPGRPEKEKLSFEFHEDFYANKANDKYPLVWKGAPMAGPLTKADIIKHIKAVMADAKVK